MIYAANRKYKLKGEQEIQWKDKEGSEQEEDGAVLQAAL